MRHPMRLAFPLSVLLLTTLLTGCQSAAPKQQAAALSEQTPASRFVVRLWRSPGLFEKVRVATLSGDALYLAGTPRGIEAIDTETGFPRWKQTGKYVVDADVAVCGDTVVYSEGGRLVSRDRKSGAELVRVSTRLGTISPVYPTENSWIFAAGNDQVLAVTPGSGLKAGHVTMDAAALSSTWDGGDLAYFLTTKGTLCAVSISTRSQAWTYTFRKPFCSPPVVAGAYLFVGCQDFYLYALDAKSGVEQWRVSVSAPALDAPVSAHGRVYIRTVDGILHAIEIATQKELWTVPNGGHVLTATKERVIWVNHDPAGSMLVIADAATGNTLVTATALHYKIFRAEPESGIFYAISQEGEVVAVADRSVAEAREAAKMAKP